MIFKVGGRVSARRHDQIVARYLIARTTLEYSCGGYKRPKRKIMHTTLARTIAPVMNAKV